MFYRVVSVLWLCCAGLLSSCSVYDGIFHPHRLGTPPVTQAAKAKARAAEKARHKGTTLQASGDGEELADTGDGTPAAGASPPTPAADTRSADAKNKAVEDMLGNTYNTKTGLLKRSKLQRLQASRRQLHHYDLRAPKPTKATRAARQLRKHPKKNSQEPTESREPREPQAAQAPTEPAPAPDPTQPAAKPAKATKAPKPAKQKASGKKDPKAPKADPTQPLPGEQ